MRERSEALRRFFARYVAVRGDAADPRIEQAFAAVTRERFAGPPPWHILATGPWSAGRSPYVITPDDDLAYLYQDTLVALDPARGINIGEPSLHAHCLDALAVQPGETVLQVGAGAGYYTAILAHLVGPHGRVHAYEIDPAMAARAARNLADLAEVTLHRRSGVTADLPGVDAIYVNAGITQPPRAWLDALRPHGRLLFPLQPEGGLGGMLLIRRPSGDRAHWPARFVSRAAFIDCNGPQDAAAGAALSQAFSGGGYQEVRTLRLTGTPDETCWVSGNGWWLSTEP